MTIDLRPWLAAVGCCLALLACTTGRSSLRGGLAPEAVANLPPNVAGAYDLFALKCSRCHTLSRPLSASIDDFGHWERYVARMRKMSGSGISPTDAETILVFLKYYAEHQKDLPQGQTETSSTGGAQ